MRVRMSSCRKWAALALMASFAGAHAAERVTLRNGFAVVCDHRQALDAEHVRLFLTPGADSYMDVPLATIAGAEIVVEAERPPAAVSGAAQRSDVSNAAGIDDLIQHVGEARRLNVDLLRSVVDAESGGHTRAVSRVGAQGLMQLMPATARSLGVTDSFVPEQNLRGGTDYLDRLLHRYHDDLQLALAAYNAGPGAVDRYHGVPPYRETRLYVARIIREFNRRTLLARAAGTAAVAVVPAR